MMTNRAKHLMNRIRSTLRFRQYDADFIRQCMSDWAQLQKYRQANLRIVQSNAHYPVIFFGDSITEAWDLSEHFPGKPFLNRGISGQTTPQLLIRFRPDVIALHPKLVVILAGTNDLAGNTGETELEQIQDNYASIAELAQVHQIRVIFSSVLPVHDASEVRQTDRRSPEKIQFLNAWIKQYCLENDHHYLDYYMQMIDDRGLLQSGLSYDGLHPNEAGYRIMSSIAASAIATALTTL